MPQIFSGIKLFGRVLYFSKISILLFQEVYRNSNTKMNRFRWPGITSSIDSICT